MDITEIKNSICKYILKSFKLIIPGMEPFEVELSHVGDFVLEKDYEGGYFPYFETSIIVPTYIARAMTANNTNLKAYIHFQYGLFDDLEVETTAANGVSDWLNGFFTIYELDNTPDLELSTRETVERDQGTFEQGNANDFVTRTIILYNSDYLFKSGTIVNAVLTSTNMADAVVYTLNSAKIGNVLMSPPGSYKTYREFVITPIPALHQLERLCNEYHLHNNGTNIFFDLDYAYILEKVAKCTAYVPNEYKTTYLASFGTKYTDKTMLSGCYVNSKERWNLVSIFGNSLYFENKSIAMNQIAGNNFAAIDVTTGDVKKVNSGAIQNAADISATNRVVTVTHGNFSTIDALKSTNKSNSKVMYCSFQHTHIKMLAPNKEFVFTTDSSKYKDYMGKYRITKCMGNFRKDGNFYLATFACEFKS